MSLQDLVSGLVAVTVVEGLELVDITQRHAVAMSVPGVPGFLGVEIFGHAQPVAELGEGVAPGLHGEGLVQPPQLGVAPGEAGVQAGHAGGHQQPDLEHRRVKGLDQVVVGPRLDRGDDIVSGTRERSGGSGSSSRWSRRRGCAGIAASPSSPGMIQSEMITSGRSRSVVGPRLQAVVGQAALVTEPLERQLEQAADEDVVIDDQDLHATNSLIEREPGALERGAQCVGVRDLSARGGRAALSLQLKGADGGCAARYCVNKPGDEHIVGIGGLRDRVQLRPGLFDEERDQLDRHRSCTARLEHGGDPVGIDDDTVATVVFRRRRREVRRHPSARTGSPAIEGPVEPTARTGLPR